MQAAILVLRQRVLILAQQVSISGTVAQPQSADIGFVVSSVPDAYQRDHLGQAGDGAPLASRRLSSLLALESRRIGFSVGTAAFKRFVDIT
jgi:hypothetical protein